VGDKIEELANSPQVLWSSDARLVSARPTVLSKRDTASHAPCGKPSSSRSAALSATSVPLVFLISRPAIMARMDEKPSINLAKQVTVAEAEKKGPRGLATHARWIEFKANLKDHDSLWWGSTKDGGGGYAVVRNGEIVAYFPLLFT
jgi:hypothetical protein